MRLEDLSGLPGLRSVKIAISHVEGWWFDTSRRVRTSGHVPLEGLTLAGPSTGCFEHLPSRVATTRWALEQLPFRNYADYTFIDMGAGRGRVLFVAAEYPFRRIEGVEFAAELHWEAQENIRHFRAVRQKCTKIESVNMNAIEYPFPNENLVLYFFNPFRSEVMERVLSNLEASLEAHPRDALLVIAYPELAPVVRKRAQFRALQESRRCCIYRIVAPSM